MSYSMEQLQANAGPSLVKLARKERLIDEAFKSFQRAVYPGAPPDQVAGLRIAFFAGAAELYAVLMVSADISEQVTDGDIAMMTGVANEIEQFHSRTIAAMNATGSRQ